MTDEELKARTDDARTALARTLVGHIRRLDDNASITILARAFGAIADASSNASTELAKGPRGDRESRARLARHAHNRPSANDLSVPCALGRDPWPSAL